MRERGGPVLRSFQLRLRYSSFSLLICIGGDICTCAGIGKARVLRRFFPRKLSSSTVRTTSPTPESLSQLLIPSFVIGSPHRRAGQARHRTAIRSYLGPL